MINSVVKRVCLSAVIAVFAGCDSNSSNKVDIPMASTPMLEAAVTISGIAAKGVVASGTVSAFAIIDGVKAEQSLAQSITDANGLYSLIIPQGSPDVPMIFEVAANENTTIKCDLAGGCGDNVAFGDSVSAASNFQLSAVLADVSSQATANLTVFSHIAAQDTIEELAFGQSVDDLKITIESANSAVASRFGFVGDVTRIPVIDITNPDALNDATEQSLTFSVFNSATISAIFENNAQANLSITDAVIAFTTQYVSEGFADQELEQTSTVSIIEIMTNASTVISIIANLDGVTNAAIASVTTSIENTTTFISLNGSTIPKKGSPSPTAGSTDLVQAKAFVQDLRVLSQESFLTESEEATFDTLQSKIDMVEKVDADNIENALKSLVNAADVAVETYQELDGEPTPIGSPYNVIVDELEYSATAVRGEADALVITVMQTEKMLSLVATINDVDESNSEMSEGESFSHTFEAIIDTTLFGSATVGHSTVTFSDVVVEVNTDGREESSSQREDFTQNVNMTLAGSLIVQQMDDAGDVNLSLTGEAELKIENIMYVEGSDSVDSIRSSDEVATLNYDALSLAFAGEIFDASGTKIDASLILSFDEYDVAQTCTVQDVCTDIEMGNDFVPAVLAFNFNAYVDGGSVADVTATVLRVSSDVESLDVVLMYDSKTVSLSSQTDRDGATIMNQDSIVAIIDENAENLLQGSIVKDQTVLADIITTSNDLVLIRYTDGTIESL